MASVTALELVNRVKRRMRDDDVTDVTGTGERAILDLVNAAIADVLTTKDWDFDKRTDGVLITKAAQLASTPWVMGTGSQVLAHLTFAASTYYGNHVVRAQVTSDANYGRSAMRINSAVTAGAGVWLGMDAPWPGSSTSAAVVNLFFAEYILPATVRSIVSVKHEEKELNLRKIDAGATFDEVIPRPYDRFDDPTTVAVGGLDIPTYEYTGGPPEPGLRLIVWPAPKEPVILRYSYYYEHPRLVNATDALVGVPASIVEDIVRIARADAMSSLERDVVEGLQTESMARKANNQKWKNSRPSPATRYTVHGWGTGRRGVNVRNGFPGVTIEE